MSEKNRLALRSLARTVLWMLGIGFCTALAMRPGLPNMQLLPLVLGTCLPFALLMPSTSIWILPRIRFRSFPLTMVIRGILMQIAVVVAFLVSVYTIIVFGLGQAQIPTIVEILAARSVQFGLISSFVLTLLISFFIAMNIKLGPGVLRNWIKGKYFDPQEEIRIFMFLDMKDSTTIAEKLGSIQFSRLVKEFFVDLTEPVLRTKAEVSHYIGDEAVITWTLENGIQNANCLRMFFLMREEIAKRTDFYQEKFGMVPEFKAGIHIGPVVATEVGEIKSEVVYHGDTLNTAARIQGLCNGLNEEFLVSGELQEALGASAEKYRFRHFGPQSLKGKVAEVVVSAVEAAPDETPKR